MQRTDFPKEYLVDFSSDDFLQGRLTVSEQKDGFFCVIDIVQKRSRKIWAHFGIVGPFAMPDDAKDGGFFKLSEEIRKRESEL